MVAALARNTGDGFVLSIRGRMSHRKIADPAAFERANYIKILQGYQRP